MEDLVNSAKSAVIAKQAIKEVGRIRLSVKDIISSAITGCKKIPKPIKKSLVIDCSIAVPITLVKQN